MGRSLVAPIGLLTDPTTQDSKEGYIILLQKQKYNSQTELIWLARAYSYPAHSISAIKRTTFINDST